MIHWALSSVCYSYQKEDYGNCSCDTNMDSDYFLELFKKGEYQKKYPDTIFVGAYVFDKKEVVEKNLKLVFDCPLLDVNLPPRGLHKLFEPVIENGDLSDAEPLDNIGIELYVEYWRKAGAKIGIVQDDGMTIVWENQ